MSNFTRSQRTVAEVSALQSRIAELEALLALAQKALEEICTTKDGEKIVSVSSTAAVKHFNRHVLIARTALQAIREGKGGA
jgi:prefoldin subunit 5